MKHVLMIACAAAAVVVFTACEESSTTASTAKKIEKRMEKPAGVPTKVFNQVKGLEKKHNKDIQKHLDK